MTALPPLGWSTMFTTWQARPVWTLLLLAAAAAYVVGLRTARRHSERPVGAVRVTLFGLALVVLWLTLSTWIGVYGERLFWVHMVAHLLLVMVVPTLLVLGRPLTVLRAAVGPRADSVLHSAPLSLLTRPLVALVVYGAVIVGTHLTGFMDQMMGSVVVSGVEEVLYLGAGWLLMVVLIGGEPLRRTAPAGTRLFLSVVAMVPDTIVGIVLLQSGSTLFPAMAVMQPAWGPGPVRDVQIGGALMWAVGDLLMMLVSVGLVAALIRDPARDRLLGSWLDGAREQALRDHVGRGGADDEGLTEGSDVDVDESALAAYNRMLGRMQDQGGH